MINFGILRSTRKQNNNLQRRPHLPILISSTNKKAENGRSPGMAVLGSKKFLELPFPSTGDDMSTGFYPPHSHFGTFSPPPEFQLIKSIVMTGYISRGCPSLLTRKFRQLFRYFSLLSSRSSPNSNACSCPQKCILCTHDEPEHLVWWILWFILPILSSPWIICELLVLLIINLPGKKNNDNSMEYSIYRRKPLQWNVQLSIWRHVLIVYLMKQMECWTWDLNLRFAHWCHKFAWTVKFLYGSQRGQKRLEFLRYSDSRSPCFFNW